MEGVVQSLVQNRALQSILEHCHRLDVVSWLEYVYGGKQLLNKFLNFNSQDYLSSLTSHITRKFINMIFIVQLFFS
jgi:hypothetical protein